MLENSTLEEKNSQQRLVQAFYDEIDEIFEPLLKWGLIREKFASLVTDSLRGKWLENAGYKVDMLEFIDESHTPKNILIRAVKSTGKTVKREIRIFQNLSLLCKYHQKSGNSYKTYLYRKSATPLWLFVLSVTKSAIFLISSRPFFIATP